MNLIQYITQADPEEKIVSRKANPAGNMAQWDKEKSKLDKLIDDNVTDENKHQYMSCLAEKGGKLETIGGWTAGLLKEVYDVTKKSVGSEARNAMAASAIFLKTALKT